MLDIKERRGRGSDQDGDVSAMKRGFLGGTSVERLLGPC